MLYQFLEIWLITFTIDNCIAITSLTRQAQPDTEGNLPWDKNLREDLEDNHSTRDNWPVPNASFVRRFYCIWIIVTASTGICFEPQSTTIRWTFTLASFLGLSHFCSVYISQKQKSVALLICLNVSKNGGGLETRLYLHCSFQLSESKTAEIWSQFRSIARKFIHKPLNFHWL